MNQFYNYNALVKFIVVYNNILYFDWKHIKIK